MVAGRMVLSLRPSSRLPKFVLPPRRNCTVRAPSVRSAVTAGSRFMCVMRVLKQPPVHEPVFGRKFSRVCGTPAPGTEKIILRPGQTEIAGARPLGDAAAGLALAARSGTGFVYPRTRPALQTGLRFAWLELLGSDSSGYVLTAVTDGVGVGVAATGVDVGPPLVGVGVTVDAEAVMTGI